MNNQARQTTQWQQFLGNLPLPKKLFMSFGSVIILIVLLSSFTQYKLISQGKLESQIIQVRMPTNIAGHDLVNGVNASLAALRGYMILGKETFVEQRKQAWVDINNQLKLMEDMSVNWTVPENISRLKALKKLMLEFQTAQQQVEDVSNTIDEQPSLKILLNDAAPLAQKIMQSITALIDEEKNQPATAARKALLSNLADSRGSFAMGLASIRAYLLSGDSKWSNDFDQFWQKNRVAMQQLNSQTDLFNNKQQQDFSVYQQQRTEFAKLPAIMFASRASEKWNMANYYLATEAAPRAAKILLLLKELVDNQNQLVAKDATTLEDNSSAITTMLMLVTLIIIVISFIISKIITKAISRPITDAITLANSISSGNLSNQIKPTFNDETGQLLNAIGKMQAQLVEREILANDFTAQIGAISKAQAIIEFNMDGTIITANENFLDTVGYSLAEIQGKHHSIFAEPEYAASNEYQTFWSRLNQGQHESAEYRRLGKNGKAIWLQASYNPIMDLDGKPFKVVKFATDITAQKNQVIENQRIANLSSALKLCNANVMLADNDRNIVYMNNGIEKMLKGNESRIQQVLPNFSVDKLLGNCVDIFHQVPAHQHKIIEQLDQTSVSQIVISELTFNLTLSPWINTDGDRLGTVVEWYDMTEELLAQKKELEISTTNALIKTALDKCKANVMMADTDLNIIYLNESVAAMMDGNETELRTVLPQFTAQKLIGTCVDDFHVNPSHQRTMIAELTNSYNTQLKLGKLTFDLIATPIFDEDNTRLGTVVEWNDITEQLASQQAEREIAATNARIKIALDRCQANVMMADNDLNIIYSNDSVSAMMHNNETQLRTALPNFNAGKLIGTCVDDFHENPAHQRGMISNLTESYQTRLPIAGLTFNLIATPIFDDDKQRLGTVVEWSDMTEQLAAQQAERQIADDNARIKQALDNVTTNTMIANASNEIIYMNRAVDSMMQHAEQDIQQALPHFNAKELMGKSIDTFHQNPAHQQGMLARLTSSYQTEINVGPRTFGLIANPINSEEGERIGTVVEWNDRTEEVAIEKEIADLISAAGDGDLTNRISEEGKSGFFLNLAGGLNQLVGIAEGVIDETATMLDSMAHGDLTKRIESDYQGSFDKLKNDANGTAEKLTEVISRINNSSSAVASGSEEIAQGNTDLSQRTEEQASSLEETASSMEQMTATVRQNADNAKIANELAADATGKAEKGGEVVKRAVNSMSEINDSSKKIADIIGVIDEIAFQTNLLALNAAVEAARAGEQGRGFAVVAGEVRNLAQRSAAAAKEIKDLIRDSVSKVQDGSQLVNESGATLNEIVDAISKVTTMIGEISIASNEQSEGIEQVNKAITQMDEMTQQNAALVEEASAAGEAMADQARGMRQILGFFTTDGSGSTSTSASASAQRLPPAAPAAQVRAPVAAVASTDMATDMDFADDGEEWEEF